jgi:hypothetical protein
MVTAAVLKGYQAAYYGMPKIRLFNSDEHLSAGWNVLLVAAEFLLGVWLMTRLYQRGTRMLAMVVFVGLMQAALWPALMGYKSCGCLGRVDVHPWFAVGVDFAILAGLVLFRLDRPERTIETHPLTFCGFLLAAVALGLPGVMTTTVVAREPSGYSYDLRHDPFLHDTKVVVDLQEPTAHDLVAGVAAQTGKSLSVDGSVREYLVACEPDWKSINHKTVRGWMALEAVSVGMPVRSRWIRTTEGYTLIGDDPLQRSQAFWWAGAALGIAGSCLLAWAARQRRSVASRSANLARLPISEVSHTKV